MGQLRLLHEAYTTCSQPQSWQTTLSPPNRSVRHLPIALMMSEVVRSKKGMGYLFNEENRLRVGGSYGRMGAVFSDELWAALAEDFTDAVIFSHAWMRSAGLSIF